MLRRRVVIVGALAMLGLVGAACSNAGSGGGSFAQPTRAGAPAPAASPAPGGGGYNPVVSNPDLPALQPHVIQTDSMRLEVKRGTFQEQFQEVALIAARHAGYVESSETSTGRIRSGTIVIRVPVTEYAVALGEVKQLGQVKAEKGHATNVTAQFVDLEARLRNWEAQEKVLLRLMAGTNTIGDSLKVQRQLQDVQLQIEEIRGQLNVLKDQTDLSTMSVSMAEAGFVPAKPKPQSRVSRAWHDAVQGFFAVVAAVVVFLGYAVPLLVLFLLAVLMWALLWTRLIKPRLPAPRAPRPMGPPPAIPPAPAM